MSDAREKYFHDVGNLVTMWNTAEAGMKSLVALFAGIAPEYEDFITCHLNNMALVNCLKELAKKRIEQEHTLAQVMLVADYFDACRQNRNALAHATFGINGVEVAENIIEFSKAAKNDRPSKSVKTELHRIELVAHEMRTCINLIEFTNEAFKGYFSEPKVSPSQSYYMLMHRYNVPETIK